MPGRLNQSQTMFATFGRAYAGKVTFDRLAKECARLASPEMVEKDDSLEHCGGLLRLE